MKASYLRTASNAAQPLALAIAFATPLFSSPVFAQHKEEHALAPIVVTATRTPQKASDVLADNVIITSEDIAVSGQTSLVDVLRQQRGIEIKRNGGPGTESTVYLRGSDGKQSILLIDGVRMGSATSGEARWQNIPLSQIERIEIVYGPLSTLYGANAVGGVVQIFTRKGDGEPRLTASAGIGTYNTKTADIGISGSVGEEKKFRYALGLARETSDGFSAKKPSIDSYDPDDDGYTRESVNGQFSLDLAKGHEIGLLFLQSKLDSQFDNSAPAGGGRRRYFDDRNHSRVESYAVFSRNQLLAFWNSQLQFARSKDELRSVAGTARSTGAGYRIDQSRFDTTQDNISWQNDFTIGPDILQVLLEHREENVDSSSSSVVRERDTTSAALSYQLNRGNHLASLSARHDNSSQYNDRSTGSLAYGYRISPALRANASLSTSFRAPTFNELYSLSGTVPYGVESNRPEKGRNAEVGLYYDDGVSQFTAVYYRNKISDMLVFQRTCPIQPTVYTSGCAYNVNEALLTGLSLGGSSRIGNFVLRASADFQNPKDETNDRLLERRAKRHATVALEHNAQALRTGVEVFGSSERFEYPTRGRSRLPGYGLVNLYASYEFAKDWTVFGRWNNVFDRDYELAENYGTEGSNLFAGIRYGFR
jgi:vitamin B12 transporter